MAYRTNPKKRSFNKIQAKPQSTTDTNEPHHKRQRTSQNNNSCQKRSKHERKQRPASHTRVRPDFFAVHLEQPDDIDLTSATSLEIRNVPPFCHERDLSDFVTSQLAAIDKHGAIDIQLIHNRHKKKKQGTAIVSFADAADAAHIRQLDVRQIPKLPLKYNRLHILDRQESRDQRSSIYQTDANLEGKTEMLKLSNLHWKSTLRHLQQLFHALMSPSPTEDDTQQDAKKEETAAEMDTEPRWMRLMEDKNGYPKCQALVQLSSAGDAVYAAQALSQTKLLGRKIVVQFSSYTHQGALFPDYDGMNTQLRGVSTRLLLTNIKQSVNAHEMRKFLDQQLQSTQEKDAGLDAFVSDVYLIHHPNRVCGGKCYLELKDSQTAEQWFERLKWQQLYHRTVMVEFGHLHNEWQQNKPKFGNSENLRGRTNRLFLSNLAWNVSREDLETLFGEALKVTHCHFNETKDGYPKGSAFVQFENEDMTATAFDQFHGKQKLLRGRAVAVDFQKPYLFANHDAKWSINQ